MERTGGGVENSGADIGLVVWSLLTFCLLSGPATGDQHAHCSEFLCLSPPTLLVRLLRFSSEQGPCGYPLDLPPSGLPSGQGLPPLPPGLPGLAPGPVTWSPLSPTVVIVPGRRPARLQPSWARVMAGELLEAGLVNVLVADWLLPPEQEITEGARQVGERLAQTIQTLLEVQGSSPELLHLVGFGVGAHVAGATGACLKGTIGRITGLDPFSPLFSEADSSLSLDHTDAQYVDVIHTNFNPNEPVAPLGVPRPLGHVDFYIGRGYQLPGCPQSLMKREQYLLCSHQRAYRLFTSSIQSSTSSIQSSCPLTAFPCQGVEDFQRALCTHCHHPGLNICPQLGYDISWLPPDRPITFQPLTAVLDITATDPFCVTPFLLEVHLEGNTSLEAQLFIQLKGDVRKTPVILVSGPSLLQFEPHQIHQFMVSVDPAVGEIRTVVLHFYSQRLLYLSWRKTRIRISHLVLTQLPRHQGLVSYRTRSVTAVENQRVEVYLQEDE